MLQYERANVVVSLTLIGLALYFVLEFPLPAEPPAFFGAELIRQWFRVERPQQGLMALLLVGLAMSGTDMVIRSHPKLPDYRLTFFATFWGLPGIIILVAIQLLEMAPTPTLWGAGLLAVGVMLWVTIVAEFQQVPASGPPPAWTEIWKQFVGYGLALLLFILIYQSRNRTLLSAIESALFGGLIALSLLRPSTNALRKVWLYATVIALILGQITWALMFWQATNLQVGLLLFLSFYTLISLAQRHLRDRLSARVLWEIGVIAGVGLLVVYNL